MNAYKFMEVFLLISVTVISLSYILDKESSEKFVFLFSKELDDEVLEQLETSYWNKLYQITPTIFIFQYKGRNITESILRVEKKFKNLLLEIEPVKHYVEVIRSNETSLDQYNMETGIENLLKPILVCEKYYGMGIENAWSRGYTGKGVVVAVTDVGINAKLKDLEPNVDDELCFNFINNSTNVTPEYFPSFRELSQPDHGNRCASLIAAVKGNEFCSAGIAFNATIAALKIFGVEQKKETPTHIHLRTDSALMARSLVYGLEEIDIYSNSWGPTEPFSDITLVRREAIKTSAGKGRRGLGAVQVFPVGSPGNELANNEYTITVSAVGQHGTVPSDSVVSASVLTSGLRNGNNITADSMVTTSFKNKCIASFRGVSAATAQVAGIIALALEARPQLTLADVQDIIVYSSDVSCIKDRANVTTNAAGHKFHPVFGFGLLNATKLVSLAEELQAGSDISSIALRQRTACYDEANGFTAEFCYSCSQSVDTFVIARGCMRVVKTAKIQVDYHTSARYIRIILISPNGTVSVLQDIESDNMKTSDKGRKQILTTVHFWDEAASGLWRFKIGSNGKTEVIGNVSLTLFGVVSVSPDAGGNETKCAPTCKSQHDDTGHSDKPVHNNSSKDSHSGVIAAVVSSSFCIIVIAIMIICIYKRRNIAMPNSDDIETSFIEAVSDRNNDLNL
ncbi:furin-1-like [Mercenaria mercenaria]|uniref:furin-1-like n=1 Tax=Mercenaria mercenaria TaxID=6596 RepID=UPI00234E5B55|nr:furin-1-like [Mercenaria mercenaria]